MNISTQSSLPEQATENWEFLLQREGDRSWLPLDSPTVEILEGRYRVVARSNHPSTAVEIRITHLSTLESPPKRRTQKRPGRTNADGLMVVAPYTAMNPGIWELSCCNDVMSELMGQGLHYAVQLHVLPQDANPDDWDPNWHLPAAPPSSQFAESAPVHATPPIQTTAPNLNSEAAVNASPLAQNPLLQQAAELSQQIVDHSVAELDAVATIEPTPLSPANPPSEAPSETGTDLFSPPSDLLQVTLSQSSYVVHRGQSITLSGQVMPGEAVLPEALRAIAGAGPLDRLISLRDPQTGEILLTHRESVPGQPLPWAFTYELELPGVLSTQLMLGEISFSQPQSASASTPLGSQTFTLISALNELLEAIADEAVIADDTLDWAEADTHTATAATGLNLSFLGFVSDAKPSTAPSAFTARSPVLPPQLYPPQSTAEKPHKSLDLPNFAPPRLESVPPELSPLEAVHPENEADFAAAPLADPLNATDRSPLSDERELPTTHTTYPDELTPLESVALTNPFSFSSESETVTYPIADEFCALKLQDRFLNRLTALATDAELSQELKDNLPPSQRLPQPEPATPTAEPEGEFAAITEVSLPLDPEAELLALEVVVDDPAELAYRAALRSHPPSLAQTLPPELVLPEDEPVPTPTLVLPDEELIAGKPLLIQVKLPNLLPRVQTKLWLNDRQTRSLLEGPRWLLDFMPDGLGDQIATAELTVPFGTVEIAIEAIAIEISTQRESHKVTVHLPVIPPNMPELELDEL